jgi:hypothetical protein
MNSITRRIALATSLLVCALGAHAQASSPQGKIEQRIDARQARQEQRIDNGVKNGSLTPAETRQVERQQDRIERAETKAEADGKITRKEAAGIEARQDKASHHIHRAKHNRRNRDAAQ